MRRDSTKEVVTQKQLKQILRYNKNTGTFFWKVSPSNNVPKGAAAGFKGRDNYCRIKIGNRHYMAHRLAWLYVYGKYPKEQIDHKNRIRDDNRINNLRQATYFDNNRNRPIFKNNTSGYTGVSWRPDMGMWIAYIRINGRRKHLGYFSSIKNAVKAYKENATKFYGEFAYFKGGIDGKRA